MDIESRDRVEAGTLLKAGDRIGHPSCEGGVSTGTHLHLARRYNGEWIPADQGIPFEMDGWVSMGQGTEYDGFLVKNGRTVEAWEGRDPINPRSADKHSAVYLQGRYVLAGSILALVSFACALAPRAANDPLFTPPGGINYPGNQHQGHPGHDLFIFDRNQDGLDDRTGKPVDVIAAASGMVVSVNIHWGPSSPIRGGNCIWIYDPIKTRYYYYAHLNEIFVKVGQIVSCGEPLGTVGRTGVKAYPKKSPTHLHFTVHQSKDGYPKPINPFMDLVTRKKKE